MRTRFIYCSGQKIGHIIGYKLYYFEIKCDLESVTRGLYRSSHTFNILLSSVIICVCLLMNKKKINIFYTMYLANR